MRRNTIMNFANVRTLQGILYATLVPVGWLLIQAAGGAEPVVELAGNPGLFVYLFVASAIALGLAGYTIGAQDQRLVRLTQTDTLTRARNREYFVMRLKEQHALGRRQGRPLTVLTVDVDYFETVNQSFGRANGDAALVRVADSIRGVLRQGETLARIGGDRFAVILNQCSSGNARLASERVCHAVSETRIELSRGVVIQATVSAGAASTDRFSSLDAEGLLDRSHRAMLSAKEAGRARAHVADTGDAQNTLALTLGVGDDQKEAA